jgi:hypothetical protein
MLPKNSNFTTMVGSRNKMFLNSNKNQTHFKNCTKSHIKEIELISQLKTLMLEPLYIDCLTPKIPSVF